MELRDYQITVIEGVRHAWREGYKRPCIVLPCGGGKSVIAAEMAKRAADNGKRILFIVHRRELCEQIENTFRAYGVDMDLCSVGMVQTVCGRLEKIPAPALIITDENHHCLAKSYRKIYDYFPDAYGIGLTATPVRLNGGGLGDINDKLIIGPSVRELIDMHCLADYDYYAPSVADLSGLKKKSTGDYDLHAAEKKLNKVQIHGSVIGHYQKLAAGKKAICYCSSVAHSKAAAEQFTAHGIPAAHIDGKTPKEERAAIVQGFRDGKITVLCNVDLISEGFDVPDCSASILLRPTCSLTLYIQQAMRCMRYQPGKRAVIIDHVGNVHRFGLPDDVRQWTLETKPARTKGNQVYVRQCPVCYFTHRTAGICPNCGYLYPKTEREIMEERKERELQKIERRVRGMQSPEECKTMKELVEYARQKGYKRGWAYYQAKSRHML